MEFFLFSKLHVNVDFNHIDDQDVSSDGLTNAQWDANAQCNASAMAMEPLHQATRFKLPENVFVRFGFFWQGNTMPSTKEAFWATDLDLA